MIESNLFIGLSQETILLSIKNHSRFYLNSVLIPLGWFQDDFLRLDKKLKKPIQTNEFPSFVRQLNLYGFR